MKTYIIAEAAGTWLHGGLDAAKRSIHLAASCGASAWKTQWTSDHLAMHKRRNIAGDAYKRLQWSMLWHQTLKSFCDNSGIDYLCTVFLPQDVAVVYPYVANGKMSAFEVKDIELRKAWGDKPLVMSGKQYESSMAGCWGRLYCVSEYPTPLERLKLPSLPPHGFNGLSDHTTSTLTGAVAVGLAATILEKHVMTHDTPHDDPDYGHSLILDTENKEFSFRQYVQNVRDAERMMYGSPS